MQNFSSKVSHPAYIPVCQLHCHLAATSACTVQSFCFEMNLVGGQSSGMEKGAWALTTQVKGILLPQNYDVNLSVQNYNQHFILRYSQRTKKSTCSYFINLRSDSHSHHTCNKNKRIRHLLTLTFTINVFQKS